MSQAFDAPIDDELATVASERVNARASVVGERFAALRYALDRVERDVCDGIATVETPDVDAGTLVEVKAVRIRHLDGDREGRLSVHTRTHSDLASEGGAYVVVLYDRVEVGGEPRIVVLASAIVDADELGRCITTDRERCDYQKVRWSRLLPDDAADGWGGDQA